MNENSNHRGYWGYQELTADQASMVAGGGDGAGASDGGCGGAAGCGGGAAGCGGSCSAAGDSGSVASAADAMGNCGIGICTDQGTPTTTPPSPTVTIGIRG